MCSASAVSWTPRGAGPVDPGLVGYAVATTRQPGARHAPLAFLSGRLFTPQVRTEVYERLDLPVLVLHDRDPFVSFPALPVTLQGENAVRASGLAYTVVRPGGLTDAPGGRALRLAQGDRRRTGRLARADVARVCVDALLHPSTRDTTFEVVNAAGASVPLAAQFARLRPEQPDAHQPPTHPEERPCPPAPRHEREHPPRDRHG